MKVVPSLLLSGLLAQVWLVPGLAPSPQSPEAPAPQNQTSGIVQAPRKEEEDEEEASEKASEEEKAWLIASGQQLAKETSNFGFSLLRKISMRHDGNMVFSPFGVSLAMAGLMLGATGPTKAQIKTGLHLQALNPTKPGLLPSLFKGLRETLSHNLELGLTQGSFAFIHKDFDVKELFLNLSKRYFDTECVLMNFHNASQAKRLMNHYINKETQGKIPKLFDEIYPETKLILVDYIWFKGTLIIFCSPKATGSYNCLSLSFR